MTRKIYKYPLAVTDKQTIDLPKGSHLLCVQVQKGVICLWASVQAGNVLKEPVTFYMFGTGHPDEENISGDPMKSPYRHPPQYLGTIQLQDGDLVFHVFAEQRREAYQ